MRTAVGLSLAVVVVGRLAAADAIHKYKLDQNPIVPGSTTANDSVGSLHGTYYGNTTSATGFAGAPNRAAHFDGSTSRVQLANQFAFNVNIGQLPNSTVTAWIKVDAGYASAERFIYAEEHAGDSCCGFRPAFIFRILNGKLEFGILRDLTWHVATVTNTPVFDTNRWYMVAGVLSSINGQAAYVFDDAMTLLASATIGNTLPTTAPTVLHAIGTWTGAACSGCPEVPHSSFLGSLQDVTFYDQALTQAQLQALPLPLPTLECSAPPPGMVSWWPGDGSPSDIQGTNNGAVVGGATYEPGMVGQAFSFNGTTAYVTAGNASSLQVSAGDFAVDAWVKVTDTDVDQSIVDKMAGTSVNSDGWRLLIQADNKFWFCFGAASNGCVPGIATTVRGTTTVQAGVWYHVAAIKSANTISIYVNGSLEASQTMGGFTDTHQANLLIGGNVQYDAYFAGLIDEVEIFNRALSESEIAAIYQAGVAGKCKPPVGPAATALAVGPVSYTYGSDATLTATLTRTSDNTGVSGATVSFTLNGNNIGSAVTAASGIATLNLTNVTSVNAGSYPNGAGAGFSGNGSFAAANGTATLNVAKATASISLSNLTPMYDGTPKAATASTTPAGLSGVAITYNGSSDAPTGAGSYAVLASLTNDNYAAPDANGTLIIGPVPLTVTADNQSTSFGEAIPALSATLSGFVNNENASVVSGAAACTTTATAASPVATYPITCTQGTLSAANYSFPAYVDGVLTISQASTTTTVSSNHNPADPGQSVNFTATVTSPTGAVPTGSVTFKDGAAVLATVNLNNGTAAFSTNSLTPGSHPITAVYAETTNFLGSTSAVLSQVVIGPTTTTLTSSNNPGLFGQPITLTATVSSADGTPAGTVTFKNGNNKLGTVALNSGSAALTLSNLAVGNHAITAAFNSSTNFPDSTSPVLTQTINPAGTTTTTSANYNPGAYGQFITWTATVSPVAPGGGTPAGTVTFTDTTTNTVLGSRSLYNGSAALAVSTLSVGTHAIVATYNGSANHTGSTAAALNQVMNKADTATYVSSSKSPSKFGQNVTFTASVQIAPPGAGTPTGTVQFFDGTTFLGTGTLNNRGIATFSTSALAAGTHDIKAAYSGSGNFNPSSTPIGFNQVVN